MGKVTSVFFILLQLTIICEKTHEFSVTLGSEISLIWKSPWGIPKLLFLLTRYLTFINLVIESLRGFAFSIRTRLRWFIVTVPVLPNLSTDTCQGINQYIYCQIYVSVQCESLLMAHNSCNDINHTDIRTWVENILARGLFLPLYNLVILTIRVWAVYDRERKMGIFLSTLLVVIFVARFIVEAFWVATIKSKHLVGCGMFISSNPLTKSNNRYFTPSIPGSERLLCAPQESLI